MKGHYCPQHRGRATVIIDTWPGRCGTCCKMAGGPGTPSGGCCPKLWDEVTEEQLARLAFDGKTYRELLPAEALVVHEGKTYVDPAAFHAIVQGVAKSLPPGKMVRMDGHVAEAPVRAPNAPVRAPNADKDVFDGVRSIVLRPFKAVGPKVPE